MLDIPGVAGGRTTLRLGGGVEAELRQAGLADKHQALRREKLRERGVGLGGAYADGLRAQARRRAAHVHRVLHEHGHTGEGARERTLGRGASLLEHGMRDGSQGGLHALGARDGGAGQLGRADLALAHHARELDGVVVSECVVAEGVDGLGHGIFMGLSWFDANEWPQTLQAGGWVTTRWSGHLAGGEGEQVAARTFRDGGGAALVETRSLPAR